MAEAWGAGLPVGSWVTFTPSPWRSDFRQSYVAKVAGYDDFRSKYRLSLRVSPTRWSAPDYWAFPSEVTPIAASHSTQPGEETK